MSLNIFIILVNLIGADGATISLSFYSGSFDNVTFTNHRGPVVRVRLYIYIRTVATKLLNAFIVGLNLYHFKKLKICLKYEL